MSKIRATVCPATTLMQPRASACEPFQSGATLENFSFLFPLSASRLSSRQSPINSSVVLELDEDRLGDHLADLGAVDSGLLGHLGRERFLTRPPIRALAHLDLLAVLD
jgi:hypothetical protein